MAKAGEYLIGQVAKKLGVSTKTLKNWEQRGLIPKPRLNVFGWRVWTEAEYSNLETLVINSNYFHPRRSVSNKSDH